jgi:hypothetical protein
MTPSTSPSSSLSPSAPSGSDLSAPSGSDLRNHLIFGSFGVGPTQPPDIPEQRSPNALLVQPGAPFSIPECTTERERPRNADGTPAPRVWPGTFVGLRERPGAAIRNGTNHLVRTSRLSSAAEVARVTNSASPTEQGGTTCPADLVLPDASGRPWPHPEPELASQAGYSRQAPRTSRPTARWSTLSNRGTDASREERRPRRGHAAPPSSTKRRIACRDRGIARAIERCRARGRARARITRSTFARTQVTG